MTKREIYSEIVARYEGTTESFEAALYELATKELHSLDVTAARNSAKRAEKLEADAPLVESITSMLGAEPITTSEIATAAGVSTSKASYILRTLVAEGVAVASDVTVKGKGKAKAYTLA